MPVRVNCMLGVAVALAQNFLTLDPPPLVVPFHAPPISVQRPVSVAARVVEPEPLTVATIMSALPSTSLLVVPVGLTGVTEVPLAVVACDPAR